MRKNTPNTGPSAATFRTAALWVLGLAVTAVPLFGRGAETPEIAARHSQAIAAARAGDYANAIAVLDDLRRAAPAERSLLADAIVVRSWAERDREVIDLAPPMRDDAMTADLARVIAKSARNLRLYDAAAGWYGRAVELDPAALDGHLGLAMTQADAGDLSAADATLAAVPESELDVAAVRAARAYVRERAGAPLAALNEYDAMLARDANDRVALRGKALALRALLLPDQALAIEAAHPGTLTQPEVARLKVDRLAIELRLTARTPYPGSAGRERAAATLTRLDAALPAVAEPAAELALRFDRIVALTDAGRPAAAVEEFESLPPNAAKPTYAVVAVSDAYRALHRPRDSLAVLSAALPAAAGNLDLNLALIYTYLDLEDFRSAFELADRVTGALPVANSVTGSAVVKGNQDRLRAELAAGAAYAYGDQLESAQARFERLLRQAPGNPDLRHELANVYRWRGWLDRSLSEYRQVLTVTPDLLPARIGYTYAQIDARDYPRVDATVDQLEHVYGREPAVERLVREWEIHNLGELEVVAQDASSTGATLGSDSYRVDATWYSRPQAYRWRALVHSHDGYALFPEGEARRQRLGAGVEYRAPRVTASAEVSAARSGGEAGLRGDLSVRLSDHWSFATLADLNGNDAPLRGYRVGVETDAAGVTATYARDESLSVTTGVRALRYTDGNHARSLFADARYRLANAPRSKLDLTGEVAASRSDRNDVAYFSPLADTTLLVGLRHEWRVFRRYERSLTQNAEIAVGRYAEDGFSAGNVWRARYTLQWQPGQRLAVGAGIERSSSLFDGVPEHSTGIVATLRARL